MQMPGLYGPYNGLYRGKRAATGQELLSAAELKEMWVMKVSNLTCFMRGIGAIDESFAIQKEFLRTSAANRLIGEVVQSRRRPLLGPSPG